MKLKFYLYLFLAFTLSVTLVPAFSYYIENPIEKTIDEVVVNDRFASTTVNSVADYQKLLIEERRHKELINKLDQIIYWLKTK